MRHVANKPFDSFRLQLTESSLASLQIACALLQAAFVSTAGAFLKL